jgi:hypothetical protein
VYSWWTILADDLSAANATIAGPDCVLSDTLPATDLEHNRVADAAGARLLACQLRVESGATLSKWGIGSGRIDTLEFSTDASEPFERVALSRQYRPA